ncbi:GntR family transcriptional regulator [Jannaschia pagri]|uniref:GntR family transcriptional regulator n=1 Tax=Jannaschia pagri TaxID=2829797 RepID=A0ABQ4NQ79_9RHOB|nr:MULTISPECIES: GntR family transcriptional regulator [unclassified Jannaschia]GIT92612.1 GntR family transcriptional regulator [Jannaschia sp. AI_61]GIT96528.1 GntR family transcriptional regulator [Jannaschia sp. AI_62]
MPLKDEAFRDLERMIVNGELEPGQWVSETDLVEVSGHTRAPIRSAIQRLADGGLLRIVARRGAQVCPIDHTEHFRSLELRRVVERLVAQSAADRATQAQKAELLEIADGFLAVTETRDQVAMTELDARSLDARIRAADNQFAARALTSVKGLSRRFWVLNQERYGDLKRMAKAHAEVATAVGQGDADLAAQAVDHLIDYVEEFTLAVVGFRSPKG